MIVCNDIVKEYTPGDSNTRALNGISLQIAKGDFVAIMGTSGSGKSTLLNILGGMDTVTEGSYRMEGIEVSALDSLALHRFRKAHVGFVFQNFALINQYTLRENVEVPLIAKGMPRKRRKAVAIEALGSVGLQDYCNSFPVNVSGGQQQRCAIARAIACGNELLLADEPTGALDSGNSDEVMQLFRKLNEEGKTIVMVTHDRHVAEYAKRIIFIEDGKIAGEERTTEQ